MLNVAIRGIGVCGPGLEHWGAAEAVLRGDQPYRCAPMNPLASVLTPGERRRASMAVRLAIEVAGQASAAAGVGPADLNALFASSDGDSDTIHNICCAISQPGYPVSPTRFHNSVHNAAAGYWSIAVGSRRPSTSLCAYDDTFAVALLDAAIQASIEQESILLVASDVTSPPPLNRERDDLLPFGCAMVLSPDLQARNARGLALSFEQEAAALEWPFAWPVALKNNPAARALPLLQALAAAQPAVVRLPYGPAAHLQLRVGAANEP